MLNDPPYKGLYRSSFEHDACGVGLICNLNNRKEHALVRDALKILVNLTHRGACGCDETTGDGAGILIQKPHLFLQQAAREVTIHLPAERVLRPAAGVNVEGIRPIPQTTVSPQDCPSRPFPSVFPVNAVVLYGPSPESMGSHSKR